MIKDEERKEVWKTIEEFPEYLVSNMGRIKSLKGIQHEDRILTPHKNPQGWMFVTFCENGVSYRRCVKYLVAQAFMISSPGKDYILCNINGNDKDNRVSNLEFRLKLVCSNKKPVAEYNPSGEFVKNWGSAKSVAEAYGFSYDQVRKCCLGKVGHVNGRRFKYIN